MDKSLTVFGLLSLTSPWWAGVKPLPSEGCENTPNRGSEVILQHSAHTQVMALLTSVHGKEGAPREDSKETQLSIGKVLAIYGEYKMQSLVRGRKRKNDSFSAGRAVMEAWRVSSCPRRALPRSLEDWVQECPIGRSTVASHRGQAATLEAESRRNWQQQRPKQEILATEEEVAQCLLDAKAQAHQRGVELQQLKAELQKAGEENTHLKASLLYPSLVRRRPGRRLTPGVASWFKPGTPLGVRGALGPQRLG
ncbi:kinetochore protein Spc24 isoform X1 [Canis lupus baileyi]|uniref:kinetochore protein Spc24 isoform X1 n=1 Tax=Canis lupus baileyi TaxID=143281 RepID=UPI003B97671A